jgi:predicted MFS family arabinose efflux permease
MAVSEYHLPLSGRDRLTIGLIGVAHGCSHFFQLVLPPLFPLLVQEFSVSFTQLGLLMSMFFLVSGLGQPLAGFLVDRVGAKRVIFLGLGLYAVGIMTLALLPSFWMFFPVMALMALGNCVFHPVDYTILSASVRASHVGRAFGVHTLGGNIGWAVAPVFMLGIAGIAGWRTALLAAGGVGLLVWLTLWMNRDVLRDGREERETAGAPFDASVLFSPTVLLCFAYFALIAAALIAVQNFIGPTLIALHGVTVALAGTALTAYLLGASAGVLAGGIAADRTTAHVNVIVVGLAGSAAAVVLVVYAPVVDAVLVALLATSGFLSGMTSPSRDMLVRSATPPGATGRVFGFVYSGLDVGSAVAPVTVGLLLDHGHPGAALWMIGGILLLAILTVIGIRGGTTARAVA